MRTRPASIRGSRELRIRSACVLVRQRAELVSLPAVPLRAPHPIPGPYLDKL